MTQPNSQNGPHLVPPDDGAAVTTDLTSVDIILDAVGDTTVRPLRSPLLRQVRPPRVKQPPKCNSEQADG
jgi:hypothetical protein